MGNQFLSSQAFTQMLRDPVGSVPLEIRHMIPGFLQRRESELIELKRMLDSNDFASIKHIGHRLKGTGGGFGLPVITEIGRELETAANAQDSDKVSEFIMHLTSVTKLLKVNFRS